MKHRTALCMSIVGALTSAYWVRLTCTPAQAAHDFVVSRVARRDHPQRSMPLVNRAYSYSYSADGRSTVMSVLCLLSLWCDVRTAATSVYVNYSLSLSACIW